MLSQTKTRVLIIGDDISAFQDYWTYYSLATEYYVVGFVHATWDEVKIMKFKGVSRNFTPIYELRSLESKINDKNIQKCFLQAQNIPPNALKSIINRIICTNNCSFEILPRQNFPMKAHKPIITFTSVVEDSGKTIIARYMISLMRSLEKKVTVIVEYQPMPKTKDPDYMFVFSHLFYEQYSQNDEIPSDLYSTELTDRLKKYQECKVNEIIVTSDSQRALISAEQSSDYIIYMATDVNQLHVESNIRICVVPEKSLKEISKVNWPGQKNFHDATHIIIIPQDSNDISKETKELYESILKPKKVFFMWIKYSLDKEEFDATKHRTVFFGRDENNRRAARQIGAPLINTAYTIDGINNSDAEYVMVTIPCDLTGVNENKRIINATKEVEDKTKEMESWITKFCLKKRPPLQEHFEAQVDVLESFAKASCKELKVQNNDSANRETFCRMFLQSHLPPDFRVTTGEVIDSHMNTTGQLDVVIVNDFCPSMTTAGDTVIGPILADTVLGVVEVKTTLTEDSLNKALSQLRSVRSLMPMYDSLETADGRIIKDPLNGKIITGIFAFNEVPGIDEKAFSIIDEYPNVVDFVVLPGSFAYFSIATLQVCEIHVSQKEVSNGYVRLGAKGMGLAMLYGLFNSIAAKRRFSSLDCLHYIQGKWGGLHDKFDKLVFDADKSLNDIDQLIRKNVNKAKNKSEMDREFENLVKTKYFKTKNQLLDVLREMKDIL